MHAEQFARTPYPQMDGEKEHNERVYRTYPHPPPVAIEDLSSEDKEILQSVSIVSEEGGDAARGNCCYPPHLTRISLRKLTLAFRRARLFAQLDHTRKSRPHPGTPWKDAPVCGHL